MKPEATDNNPKRVLVIGLDGATWTLVKPWAAQGALPNLARLMEEGTYGVLESVWPALSPSAWASFMTGTNPGQHGVYDFLKRERDSYQLRLVWTDQIDRPTIWRLLSEKERRVGVMNVPMTYPPEGVHGFLVSGLGTPDFKPFAYPPSLYEELKRQGYRVNKQVAYQPGKEADFLAEAKSVTDSTAQIALQLMESEPWDLFMFVFRDTDEMAHFFWRFTDESHPAYDPDLAERWGDAIQRYYQLVDKWVGRMLAQAGPETAVFIISDHGAGPLHKDVYLNVWLEQKGFLAKHSPSPLQRWFRRVGLTRSNLSQHLRGWGLGQLEAWLKERLGEQASLLPASERLDLQSTVDWSRTKAYSFGYHGQIYLNVHGREPQGIVEPGAEYERVRDELIEELLAWRDPQDNLTVVTKLFKREEIYEGEHIEEAPDLIIAMRDLAYITRQGYEFGRGQDTVFASPATHETGSHRLEGIAIGWGPGMRNRGEVEATSIMDLAPTILYLLGESIPSWMDGRIMRKWIIPELLIETPPHEDSAQRESRSPERSWSDDDERNVMNRLRDLGYLG